MATAIPAFFSSLFAAASSTAGIATIAGVGAGLASSKLLAGKSTDIPAPLPPPQPPRPEAAADKADEIARRRRAVTTRSVYTSPLGVSGEAQVVRKTLLGQ